MLIHSKTLVFSMRQPCFQNKIIQELRSIINNIGDLVQTSIPLFFHQENHPQNTLTILSLSLQSKTFFLLAQCPHQS